MEIKCHQSTRHCIDTLRAGAQNSIHTYKADDIGLVSFGVTVDQQRGYNQNVYYSRSGCDREVTWVRGRGRAREQQVESVGPGRGAGGKGAGGQPLGIEGIKRKFPCKQLLLVQEQTVRRRGGGRGGGGATDT